MINIYTQHCRNGGAPIHFRSDPQDPNSWIFLVLPERLSPDKLRTKVRCPQPTRSILDRWQFEVQPDSFSLGRLTLDAISSAGNMVFHSPLKWHQTKAL
jgi:hypothetical protein